MMGALKNIIILAGLLALAGLGYYLFVLERGAVIEDEVAVSQSEIEAQDFLRRIADIESITLSTAVLTDNRFRSLRNFGSEVDSVSVGRSNPFVSP